MIEGALKTRAKHYLPAIIWLAAEHGASHPEILDLRWTDVILDGDHEQIRFLRTKNGMERTFLKIGPESKRALLHWREHLAGSRVKRKIDVVDEGGWIFIRLNGRPILGFRSAWKTAKLKAGLNDFHFHDLRHTFCSNLALAGANLKDIKEMIGHDDISMTDRYTHLGANRQVSLQNMLFEQYELPTSSGIGSGEHIGNTGNV